MEIFVRTKSVFGRDLVYPVCESASLLCALTGAKTIGPRELSIIKRLGYVVSEKGRQL